MNALDGLGLGWSVIPVRKDKRPFLSEWKPYQTVQPDEAALTQWQQQYKPPAWAVVTGAISGIVVLDFDGEKGAETMRSLGLDPHVRTPSGGFHVYFQHPGFEVKTLNGKSKAELGRRFPGLDIRGDGGYAVFCGRNSAGRYEWLREPVADPVSIVPAEVRGFLHLDTPQHASVSDKLLKAALKQSVTGRNDAGFWLACQLRDNGLSRSDAESVMTRYQASTGGINTKGHPEEYGVEETLASLEQAYSAPARESSIGRVEVPCGGRKTDQRNDDQPIRVKAWPDALAPEAFHGLAGDLVRALEPHTEADPAALLSSFFVAFGNLIGRTAYFVAEADKHYLNLFLVLVGTSSKGRKGVSFRRIQAMLGELDADWESSRIHSGLSSGEGLIWAVRDPIEKQEPIRDKRAITGYQTLITDEGISDKRLLCLETEFASVLRVLSREGNTLSAIMRNAWDTGTLTALTKNSPAHATGAHVSIIGHISKEELLRYLESTEAGNGFANRFLWSCVRRSKCLPEGGQPNPSELNAITDRLKDCIRFARGTGQMERDQEARELWHEVYPDLSEGKPGLLGAMIARAEAQVMRLACIYALLDRSSVVRVEHLRAALAFWRYCEESARYIFGDSLGDPIADELLQVLRERPDGMTRWEITGHFGRNKPSSALVGALGSLLESGLARSEKEASGGRPAERWFATAPPPTPPDEEYEVHEETGDGVKATSYTTLADTDDSSCSA